MRYTTFYALLIIFFLLACGNSTSSTDTKTKSKSSSTSCLESLVETPCSVLTEEEVLTILGFSMDDVNLDETQTMKVARRKDCIYMWESGRSEMVDTPAGKFDSKIKDRVIVGQCRIYDSSKTDMSEEDWFDFSFPTISAEELAAKETQHQEKVAKGDKDMVGAMMIKTYKNLTRESFTGVGDRAIMDIAKNMSIGSIHVLDKNVAFTVSVDVSKDPAENIKLAKKVAKSLISSCN